MSRAWDKSCIDQLHILTFPFLKSMGVSVFLLLLFFILHLVFGLLFNSYSSVRIGILFAFDLEIRGIKWGFETENAVFASYLLSYCIHQEAHKPYRLLVLLVRLRSLEREKYRQGRHWFHKWRYLGRQVNNTLSTASRWLCRSWRLCFNRKGFKSLWEGLPHKDIVERGGGVQRRIPPYLQTRWSIKCIIWAILSKEVSHTGVLPQLV